MNEYISREEVIKKIAEKQDKAMYGREDVAFYQAIKIIREEPAADVKPLSVVAEHIKNRLYETAFNTTEEKARNAIADMAGRIDFWIDELKGGDTE